MFIAALFVIARSWEKPIFPSTKEWLICGTFIQWNIILLVKKMIFVGKLIELENIILSKVAQTQKDKYCMISLICGC